MPSSNILVCLPKYGYLAICQCFPPAFLCIYMTAFVNILQSVMNTKLIIHLVIYEHMKLLICNSQHVYSYQVIYPAMNL